MVRRRTLWTARALVAIALLLGTTAIGTPAADAAVSYTVRGTVACPSGKPVVGVWVQSSGGGSRFASWTRYPGASTMARFSATFPTNLATNVYLNVGCGGTTQTWASTNRTPTVRAGSGVVLYVNTTCNGAGSCSLFPRRTTPASPAANPAAGVNECTYRASEFWKQITAGRYPNWGGNAHEWDDRARDLKWTVGTWPRIDSIVVWQANSAGAGRLGHVGYVADLRASQGRLQMKVYDRNWGSADRNGVWVNYVSTMRFIVSSPRTSTTLR